jgi:hypothetical protein
MRTLAIAVAVLALLTVSVQAQMGGGKRGHKSDDANVANKKPKVDDKAYQEALKRIPEPKEKYDPWAVTKTPDADKKSSK